MNDSGVLQPDLNSPDKSKFQGRRTGYPAPTHTDMVENWRGGLRDGGVVVADPKVVDPAPQNGLIRSAIGRS